MLSTSSLTIFERLGRNPIPGGAHPCAFISPFSAQYPSEQAAEALTSLEMQRETEREQRVCTLLKIFKQIITNM